LYERNWKISSFHCICESSYHSFANGISTNPGTQVITFDYLGSPGSDDKEMG